MCNDENKKRQELVCSVERLNMYLKYLAKEVETKKENLEKELPKDTIQIIDKFLEIAKKYNINVTENFLSVTIPENGMEVRSNIKDNLETISAMYAEIASIQFNLLSKVAILVYLNLDSNKIKQDIDELFKEVRDLLVKINNQ